LKRKDEGAFRRHAIDGTLRREAQYCVPPPDLGYVGADTVNRAASDWDLQIANDVFGPSLAAALVPASTDAATSACQLATMRGYGKLCSTAMDGLTSCLRSHLSSGADWNPSVLSSCIDGSDNGELVKLERAESAFVVAATAACTGVSVSRAFPGDCSAAPTIAAALTCMTAPARCRTCRMSEVAFGVVANCETFDNGLADGSCPADTAACGNGIADSGEECDNADLRDQSCSTVGFAGGKLSCNSACEFDTSACSHCGDGVVGQDEQCDAGDLAGATCASLGFQGGTVACSDQCRFDTAGCTVCGDGSVGGTEQCDGANLAGQSCQSLGFDIGTLTCTPECQFDTTACYRCGDNNRDPGEQCDGDDLGGQTCTGLGFVAGQLGCSQACSYDTSLCFSGCNQNSVPPADLKFGVGDSLWMFGDSITSAFHENRYHYGRILLKVLGASYCSYTDGFSVYGVGHKGSTYAHYRSYVRHGLPAASGAGRQWVMFQDFGKTVKLSNDRFENAVRSVVDYTRSIDPSAGVLLGTTPPLEETPDRPGVCHYYSSICNFVAHNDIVASRLSSELAVDTVPWDEDFCRLLWRRQSLLNLEFTTDGIHPRPLGNLGLALSILKWAGVPRQDLALSGLDNLHPDLTVDAAEQIADWIYDPTVFDCSEILEPCGLPGRDCIDYLSGQMSAEK